LTDPAIKTVIVRDDLSPAHAVKTLVHERAHMLLGHVDSVVSRTVKPSQVHLARVASCPLRRTPGPSFGSVPSHADWPPSPTLAQKIQTVFIDDLDGSEAEGRTGGDVLSFQMAAKLAGDDGIEVVPRGHQR
jgi:hypothetical protein